jgi:hypothetical protein
MTNLKDLMKYSRTLLLLIFPFFTLIAGAYFRNILGDLSLRSVDPDYVYFSNGLGVSQGFFDTGNIFHPGSPLQYFTGLIFRLVYLIRSPGVPYLDDVFINPDLYMSVVSISFIGVLTSALIVSGFAIYRITGSIIYSMLIQTTVFLPIIWYDLIGRVVPETMQSLPVLVLAVLVIFYYKKEKLPNSLSDIWLLALACAFGLSAKVTFIPLLLIPVIIIENWKGRIKFLMLTFVFFLIMSVSVLLKLEVFWNWTTNIFLHGGEYGAGQANIINLADFKKNLISIVKLEKWFFQMILISFLVLVFHLVIIRKKGDRHTIRFTLSVLTAIVVQLLIVSKHFAHRNIIPALLLLPLVIYFTSELLRKQSKNKIYNFTIHFIVVLFLAFTVRNQFLWLPVKSNAMYNDVHNRKETQTFISTLDKNSIRIITSQSYGCPFPEYSLMYSTAWAENSLKPVYAEVLGRLYPYTYQHTTWDDRFQYWAEKFDVGKILSSDKLVYLYIERDDEELYSRTLGKLKEESTTPFNCERELLYRNPVTTEVVFKLRLSVEVVDGN